MDDSKLAMIRELIGRVTNDHDVWFGSNIPKKKLDNAIAAYAKGVVPERVLALHDATIFGKADEGFLITDAAFYCRNFCGETREIRFESLRATQQFCNADESWLVVKTERDGASYTFRKPRSIDELLPSRLGVFFDKMIELRDRGHLATEDRYVIVQDMSEPFRIAYVDMAVFLALADDGEVDAGELAEIQLLMTRLELSPASRREVWRFLSAPTGSPEDCLANLESLAPKGAWTVLSLSLVKDLMGVSRRRRAGVSEIDPFIRRLAASLGITDEKLGLIQDALAFEEAMLSGNVKASQVRKMGTDLAAKAGAVGVPLVAIYLSGSVVGLSAAGITSGLAALGFGGLFGLGAMVSGIGVVIVVGVVVYKVVRWLAGSEETELAALREKLMQEVVKQLQRSVNALLEDLTVLTADVVDLTRQTRIDEVRMRKLAQEVQSLTQALAKLARRQQSSSALARAEGPTA